MKGEKKWSACVPIMLPWLWPIPARRQLTYTLMGLHTRAHTPACLHSVAWPWTLLVSRLPRWHVPDTCRASRGQDSCFCDALAPIPSFTLCKSPSPLGFSFFLHKMFLAPSLSIPPLSLALNALQISSSFKSLWLSRLINGSNGITLPSQITERSHDKKHWIH